MLQKMRLVVVIVFTLLNSRLTFAADSGRGSCLIFGRVKKIEQSNDSSPSKSKVSTTQNLSLEDIEVKKGDGDGQCSRVNVSAFNPTPANGAFAVGDQIEIELACHYLGSIHSCEVTNAGRTNWTKNIPIPTGTSLTGRNSESTLTSTQTVRMMTVKEVRNQGGSTWIAGTGSARFGDGQSSTAGENSLFEVTLSTPQLGQSNCNQFVRRQGPDFVPFEILGTGFHTSQRTSDSNPFSPKAFLHVFKFVTLDSCQRAKEKKGWSTQ